MIGNVKIKSLMFRLVCIHCSLLYMLTHYLLVNFSKSPLFWPPFTKQTKNKYTLAQYKKILIIVLFWVEKSFTLFKHEKILVDNSYLVDYHMSILLVDVSNCWCIFVFKKCITEIPNYG